MIASTASGLRIGCSAASTPSATTSISNRRREPVPAYFFLGPWLKDALDRRIAKLEGVRDIGNEIRVAPASGNDDRLRAQLYRRIYGDDLFVRYSNWAEPPIRIIVENGRVTLTGVVNSAVEQVKLGMIARGTLAFGVDSKLEVESQRPKEPSREVTQS